VDHILIVKNFEKKKNYNSKSPLERQVTKKRPTINASIIFFFGGGHGSLQKNIMCIRKIMWRIWVYQLSKPFAHLIC
jgi:hypothetical protein